MQEYLIPKCMHKKITTGGKHMGMTPDQFFEGFVQGNYDDYKQHLGSVRHAFNAALSASHLADHYFVYYGKHSPSKVGSFPKIGNFVEYLSNKTDGCFRDIRSISNAYKHLYTSDDPMKGAHSSISSTMAIETVTLDDADVQQLKEIGLRGLKAVTPNRKLSSH